MTIGVMTTLITTTLTTYGGALLVILGAVIGIGVAYLVFLFGWSKVKGSTGYDYDSGGIRTTKGGHRVSRAWDRENMRDGHFGG